MRTDSFEVRVRKAATHLLNNRARRRLLSLPCVSIDSSAKLLAKKVRLYPLARLTVGKGSIIEATLIAERDGAELYVGQNTFIGNSLIACATKIEIGDDVLISWGCNIVDHNSHAISWPERADDVKNWYQGKKDWTDVITAAVKIHSKSWIGFNVIILKGVEIGEGAVIGAGSVVTKNVPPWTVAAGNPAGFVRSIPPVGDRESIPWRLHSEE